MSEQTQAAELALSRTKEKLAEAERLLLSAQRNEHRLAAQLERARVELQELEQKHLSPYATALLPFAAWCTVEVMREEILRLPPLHGLWAFLYAVMLGFVLGPRVRGYLRPNERRALRPEPPAPSGLWPLALSVLGVLASVPLASIHWLLWSELEQWTDAVRLALTVVPQALGAAGATIALAVRREHEYAGNPRSPTSTVALALGLVSLAAIASIWALPLRYMIDIGVSQPEHYLPAVSALIPLPALLLGVLGQAIRSARQILSLSAAIAYAVVTAAIILVFLGTDQQQPHVLTDFAARWCLVQSVTATLVFAWSSGPWATPED